jgi:hypothetical protein
MVIPPDKHLFETYVSADGFVKPAGPFCERPVSYLTIFSQAAAISTQDGAATVQRPVKKGGLPSGAYCI